MEQALISHIWLKQFICLLVKFFYIKVAVQKNQVILLAPTGVAAININGTTIHTALGINVGTKMFSLNDCQEPHCVTNCQKYDL